MDSALVKDHQAFLKKAMILPVIEKKKPRRDFSFDKEPNKRRAKQSSPKPKPPSLNAFNYKALPGSSKIKFSILTKIVQFMRQRHQRGDTHSLSLEEILDETNQLDVQHKLKLWLVNEALVSNVKIQTEPGGRYSFKPPHNLKDRKSLLRLLEKHDLQGMGGIWLEEVQESLPKCDKALKSIEDKIVIVTRPDKKKVLFNNDKTYNFEVDDEFQKMWRSITVDGLDEAKIEEYLEKQGITSMQDYGPKKIMPMQRRKKAASKKPRSFKKHNDHLINILEDYSELTRK